MEAAERKYEYQMDVAKRQKQQDVDLEMKRLELAAQTGTASADDRRNAPAFRIDTAVKLRPKFNEYDVESFLISFEKIAQRTSMQVHLIGKALKVFTELSVEDCQDYPKLK